MSDEQRKEIIKALFYGYSKEKVAEIEEISIADIDEVIEWDKKVHYTDDLKEKVKSFE